VRKRDSSILDGALSGLVYYLKYPIRTMHKKFELSKFKIKPVQAHLKFESTGKYGTTYTPIHAPPIRELQPITGAVQHVSDS
jgi:hypothetical protein